MFKSLVVLFPINVTPLIEGLSGKLAYFTTDPVPPNTPRNAPLLFNVPSTLPSCVSRPFNLSGICTTPNC